MIMSIDELAMKHPSMRRYAQQGFVLSRPVLSLELEIQIESQNQSLTVNVENSSVRQTQEIPAF